MREAVMAETPLERAACTLLLLPPQLWFPQVTTDPSVLMAANAVSFPTTLTTEAAIFAATKLESAPEPWPHVTTDPSVLRAA